MNLRQQAAADARAIVQDVSSGFGWDLVVTNPEEKELAMVGLSSDVHMAIDPETGVMVSGRRAHVTLIRKTLIDAGMGTPVGKADRDQKPWRVRFDDIDGQQCTFKVSEAMPDRALGIVVCILEAYRASPR